MWADIFSFVSSIVCAIDPNYELHQTPGSLWSLSSRLPMLTRICNVSRGIVWISINKPQVSNGLELKITDLKLTTQTADSHTDRQNTAVTSSSSHGNSEEKAGKAVIGWQARSGRTISEGLKGFPWPLMPPEILKPRPGFFSILTHNWRKERTGKRQEKEKKNTWKWNAKIRTISKQA